MNKGIIYKITNPSGHCYIGQTIDWNSRYRKYKNLICKDQPALYNSFIKYGFENHWFEILMSNILKEELNFWEKFWILKENTYKDPNHLNLTEGGDNSPKSLETRIKISLAKKGIKNPNHSQKMKGRKYSEEHKQKMRLSNKSKKGFEHINSKNVLCLDTNQVFGSIRETAKYFNGNYQILSRHLNKKYGYPFFKGHRFVFKEDING